jgi:hypothetical protein
MSMEQSFLPDRPALNRTAAPWAAEPGAGEAWSIRRQAAGIIAMVLADFTPEQARARDHLRKCVDAHPGQPEIALAEHLSALRRAAAEGLPVEWLAPGQGADGTETPKQPALSVVGQMPPRPAGERGPVLHHQPTPRARYGRAVSRGLEGNPTDGS